ncbi:MAG: response regulator transcription factor [Bacteroidia bacterium]
MKDLSTRIEEKLNEIAVVAHLLPSVVIIHNIQQGFTVEYMSERGLKHLGVTNDELKAMGLAYYPRYFNVEDAEIYVPKLHALLSMNNINEVFTFFQQVRRSPEHDWEWYMSATKLLLRDDNEQPLFTITQAVPIDPQNHVTQKVERLLEENTFMRKNYEKYAMLTRREKELLRQMALAKTNKEIAELLFLSVATVETHKRNIKQKLNIRKSTDLSLFARAFDLI